MDWFDLLACSQMCGSRVSDMLRPRERSTRDLASLPFPKEIIAFDKAARRYWKLPILSSDLRTTMFVPFRKFSTVNVMKQMRVGLYSFFLQVAHHFVSIARRDQIRNKIKIKEHALHPIRTQNKDFRHT